MTVNSLMEVLVGDAYRDKTGWMAGLRSVKFIQKKQSSLGVWARERSCLRIQRALARPKVIL